MNYDVTLNEVCTITTVSGKKDETKSEYSLSTCSSTALLVVCRHANDEGGGIYYIALFPGVDLLYSRFPPG